MDDLRRATLLVSLILLFSVSFPSKVSADETERLFLQGGKELSGTSRGFRDGHLRWEFSEGMELLVPLTSIERLEYPPPSWEENPQGAIDAERFKTPSDEDPEIEYGYWERTYGQFGHACERALGFVAHSTRRIEIGARFLDGNSDNDFLNASGRFEKNTGAWISQLELGGQYVQKDGDATANRWTANSTVDYDNGLDERWILFVTNKNEYDEFENLDYRGTYSTGIGYRFYNEGKRRLVTRLGPAVTVEVFRDPENVRTTPDAFGEVESFWPLGEWIHYEAKSNIRLSLEDTEVFRIVSRHGLIMQLDEHGRWSLKLGLRYEYNSKPHTGRLRGDYTSSILVIYTWND
jgi:putative salt-induced outer membrane protein YdiY